MFLGALVFTRTGCFLCEKNDKIHHNIPFCFNVILRTWKGETQQAGLPKEVPTSFECFKNQKGGARVHVERWISGVEGVFRHNGVGFRSTRVDSMYERWISDKTCFLDEKGGFQNLKGGFPSLLLLRAFRL